MAFWDITAEPARPARFTRPPVWTGTPFGLVLLAKNAYVHRFLNDLHEKGALGKIYHGLVYHAPPEAEGVVDRPIGRCPEAQSFAANRHGGKTAPNPVPGSETLAGPKPLELQPLTGRTHQLRVHCAFLGCPMLGDPQYGTPESRALSAKLGLTHQQLCARELHFPHPITGVEMNLQSGMEVRMEMDGT